MYHDEQCGKQFNFRSGIKGDFGKNKCLLGCRILHILNLCVQRILKLLNTGANVEKPQESRKTRVN